MNKVICDVCGTAYGETANQCPICGCAKVSSQVAADTGDEETTARTYVKGGRFSKKNVKNRGQLGKTQDSGNNRRQNLDDEEKTNKGLVAVVILLLIAIVGVVIYIGLQFFDFQLPSETTPQQTSPSSSSSQPSDSQGSSDPSGSEGILCTNILLSNGTLEFLSAGDKWTLEVELSPINCTETVVFSSADDTIATVSQTGEVVAVGAGETVITATCGSVSAECKIRCNFPGASNPTDPSESTGPSGEFVFEFDTPFVDEHTGKWDTTFTEKGYTWRSYKRGVLTVDPSEITWVSDNPDVCTVEDGIVTMVGPGMTEVHAQYNGKTYTCIVRCSWKEAATDPSEGSGVGEGGGDTQTPSYKISHTDVTIAVDEAFWLRLKDSDSNNADVIWTVDHEGYVLIEGDKITGVKSTNSLPMKYVLVSVTVDEVTYSCMVRVK